MKRTFFVTLITILAIFQAGSVLAVNIQVDTAFQDAHGQQAQLHIELANGREAALALLQQKSTSMGVAPTRILVSDMSAESVAAELNESLPKERAQLTDRAIGFFEIDEPYDKPQEQVQREKRKEHIQGVAFALVQTGVSTIAFMYVSNLPLVPAVVSSALAGFLNLYFNWDIERWDKFQRWGRDKMGAGVALLGKKNWQHTNWFNKTTKSITGYVGRIGFAAMFTGIALWDGFFAEFLSMHTAERIAISSFIGALMSQSFDTTLGDWLEKGHKVFSEDQIKLMMRVRSLVTSAIIPLVYLEYKSAYLMAVGMFFAGISVAVYDQHENIEEKFVVGFERIKNSVKDLWKKKFTDGACGLFLKGEEA